MALGPRLDLRQSQSLVMTPQLQQAIKLLALSNLEIETFIGDALEANPLLEVGDLSREADEAGQGNADEAPAEPSADAVSEGDAALDIDPAAAENDRETGDGAMGDGEWGSAVSTPLSADAPDFENHCDSQPTLAEHLTGQALAQSVDPQQEFLAVYLVGQLDDAGYLVGALREIAEDLDVPVAEVEKALALVHTFDPTGVGARDLSECLALQAIEADRHDPCMARLIDNLELVARGEFARLKRICQVDDEDFVQMLSELRTYDPKPGLKFGGVASAPIVPDIMLTTGEDGGWVIKLNEETLPRLVVNRDYLVELQSDCTDKISRGWLNEKLTDANWLIKALDQRQKTILKTASEIVKQQDGFFRNGVSELRPLTLREVAEAIEMHESTVSRVTSNKFLHCERGTFELKYFFTSGVGSTDGEGASSEAVKARIKALTDEEDSKKILSDDKLVEMLKTEGFDLARRTVAKYRESMGIGSSVQRRRAKKLDSIS